MIFVKNSMQGREVNMINTVSKINLSKIGGKGGGSTSIWMMTLNILDFFTAPLSNTYNGTQTVVWGSVSPLVQVGYGWV